MEESRRPDFDSKEFQDLFHYDGPLGVELQPDATVFRLWAPTAERVIINLYRTGSDGAAAEQAALTYREKGVWEYRANKNLNGRYYDYDVTADGVTRRTQDPYARSAGCNGARSMALDLRTTDPEGWGSDAPPAKTPENIIYELHVKDFSWDASGGFAPEHRGRYLALTEKGTTVFGQGAYPTGLDYLQRLGVTHIQLMPVADYASVREENPAQYNWGYDPLNYNVPEGSYASDPFHGEVRVRELKQAIQAMHREGFRVILDVVYNHTYTMDSCLFATVPWYFYRCTPDGKPSNGSGCGNDIASERSMCARYIADSVLYWAEEYHVDGFRFDLMGLLDVELMRSIRKRLDDRFGTGEKLLYGEPWSAAHTCLSRPVALADKAALAQMPGIGAFFDYTRDAVKGSFSACGAPGFVNGGGMNAAALERCLRGWNGLTDYRALSPDQIVTYLSAHDDHTLWDKLIYTMRGGAGFTGADAEVMRANRLAAAICFACPGHLFFLAGEEFGRTKCGDGNTYNKPASLNRLDWGRAAQNRTLVDYYRGLIALRKQLPGLCDKTAQAAARFTEITDIDESCVRVRVDNAGGSRWQELLLYFNAACEPSEQPLPAGFWQVLADEASAARWQEEQYRTGSVTLSSISAQILGR